MQKFNLDGHEYITLCDLLKTVGICQSGGEAKALIAKGAVRVDGKTELRKRCKVRENQLVEFEGQKVLVGLS